MIFLSESYLDASASSDIDNPSISGYKLVKADHPGHVKEVLYVCILRNPYL